MAQPSKVDEMPFLKTISKSLYISIPLLLHFKSGLALRDHNGLSLGRLPLFFIIVLRELLQPFCDDFYFYLFQNHPT